MVLSPCKFFSGERPFKRSLRLYWLSLLTTTEISVTADLPPTNHFCADPETYRTLPNIPDIAGQMHLPKRDTMSERVSLMKDLSSVDHLQQSISAARRLAECAKAHLHTSNDSEVVLRVGIKTHIPICKTCMQTIASWCSILSSSLRHSLGFAAS